MCHAPRGVDGDRGTVRSERRQSDTTQTSVSCNDQLEPKAACVAKFNIHLMCREGLNSSYTLTSGEHAPYLNIYGVL